MLKSALYGWCAAVHRKCAPKRLCTTVNRTVNRIACTQPLTYIPISILKPLLRLRTVQEAQLLVTLQQREAAVAALRAANEDKQRAVASAEAMFTRVRQATGVNTLEEMLAKFSNQVQLTCSSA
jgi:hypothetical protein